MDTPYVIEQSGYSRRHWEDDFMVVVRLKDASGNPVRFPDCDFDATLSTETATTKFTAGRRNGNFRNCRPHGEAMLIMADSHGLRPGTVSLSLSLYLPSENPDGDTKVCIHAFNVMELTRGPGDMPSAATVTAAVPYISGKDFDPAEMSEEKKLELVESLPLKTVNGTPITGDGDIRIEGTSGVESSEPLTTDEIEKIAESIFSPPGMK